MIDVIELKNKITLKNLDFNILLFLNSENDFLSSQYVREIAKSKELEINYIDDIDKLFVVKQSLFSDEEKENYLNVYRVDDLKALNKKSLSLKNTIIIANKISNEVDYEFNDVIVKFPKIEEWQFKDYAYSIANGADTKDIDYIISVCNNDIYRLDNELSKIKLFSESERKFIVNDFIANDIFSDLKGYSVFNLINAIQNKDVEEISLILSSTNISDIDPIGFCQLLILAFKKMILVWTSQNPTEASTGIKQNQIYAIKKLPRNYSKEQLIQVYKFLTEIDFKLKSGCLDYSTIIDYIIIKILSF